MRWPGNVRQLRNTLERALILGPDRRPDRAARSWSETGRASGTTARMVLLGAPSPAWRCARRARLFEREYLVAQINRFGGNISRTATFVGMERSALHRKLKSLGVVTTNKSGARVAHVDVEEV